MQSNRTRPAESGYVLLAVMLAFTLILLALSIEAPRIAQQIKRDKEEELVHRGKDYATAVKRYVHKNGGRYPVSIEQLEDTNHIRFLRKKYKDPMTGEADWRMVHFGEAQIVIPATNPGLSGSGNPGLQGSAPIGAATNPPAGGGQPTGIAPTLSGGGQSLGQTQAQPPPGSNGQLGSLTTSNIGNGQTVGGGQIIGVASVNKSQSIKEFNEKDHYDEWFFVYDLRLEQSGGTGVAVAAPRGAAGTPGALGPQAPPTPVQQSPAQLPPGVTPVPTPPPSPPNPN
jgi:type II secretory pathway pseudopilin PulG